MGIVPRLLRSIAAVAVLLFAVTSSLVAQDVVSTSGKMGLMEGCRYMVAFPQVWASTSEIPTPKPMLLFISSKTRATVTISTPAPSNDATVIRTTRTLQPNEVLQFEIPIPLMNTESETKSGYGISVTANRPISVSTYQAWMGNGELARHLPVEAWGRNYYTMNFYQDRYGMNGSYKYRPSQILVIANRDNTTVSYTPTTDTEGGRDQPSVRKGQTGTVVLNKGETFLIKAKINEPYNKEWSTDLSGTWIRSSSPVGVISGHTKLAVMRYPDVLPPTGMFATEAHFVRNNVHDAMLPFEMAGKEFVTVPAMYGPLRITGRAAADAGIEDDRGDVIRFIALEDGTQIEAMREDGSDFKTIMKLDRGETWLETSVQTPTMWRSNKPMLVGQYGKSYAKVIPPVTDGKGGDATQGHPTVESGMPMLEYVPSTDRFVSYAVFHAPDGMDNFINIVFKPEQVTKIKINGSTLNGRFGGAMRELKGTPYWYIRHPIPKGDYVIESESEDVRWMAWSYGSLDGLNMGRAYGTPVAVDLAIDCDDSLAVTEEILCGDVKAEGKILPEDSECGSIFMVYAESADNYELVVDENFESGMPTVKFQVNVINKRLKAKAVVRVVTRSGRYVEKTYEYTPDKIDWSPKQVDFGAIPIGTPSCKTITFTNLRTDAPVTVKELRVKYYPQAFKFNPTSFSIPPGQSMTVQVCATTSDTRELVDTVIASLECFDEITSELRVRSEEPLIYVGDQLWVNIPATSPGVERPVEIVNASDVNLTITGYDKSFLDGSGNFFNPRNLDEVLPLTIPGGGRHTFFVTYSPRGQAGVVHTVNVPFYSNATKVDNIATLTGNGVEIDLYASALPWDVRVLDNVQLAQNITSYGQTVEFQNTGELSVEFSTPFIRGTDAGSFRIVDNGNTGGFPITLVGGTRPSANINIEFIPTELASRAGERNNYVAELVFPTNSDAQKEVVVELKGTAWQPQVKGADQNFGVFNVGDATSTLDITISNTHYQDVTNPTSNDAKGTHGVVITGINIVGAANNFKINNGPTEASPWRLAPGEERQLSVTFDPSSALAGPYSAQYEIVTKPENMTEGAAPYTPVYTLTAEVIGGDFSVRDAYARQYVLNTTEMVVEVRHSEAQPRTYDVGMPKGADANAFTVVEPSSGVLTVAPGQTGQIRVRFSPDYVTLLLARQNRAIIDSKGAGSGIKWRDTPAGQAGFTATIDVTDQVKNDTRTATVTGDGLFLETTNYVGEVVSGNKQTDYKVKPGESVAVAVSLDAVPESLDPVKLTEMRVRLSWDPKIVQPRTNPSDFILNGTLAEGWSILNVATFPENSRTPNSMEIDIADMRATKTPLVNDPSKAFLKVVFDAYLGIGSDASNVKQSPVNVYSYTVDFDGSNGPGVTQAYALFNDVPGTITLDYGCAGELRLVKVSSANFGVKPVSPNPATGTAKINYSIGLSGHTSIVLFNYAGERVMDILDAQQASGEYEITLDVSTVPAGTYYYRVISGPYMSEPQALTIVR